MSSSKCMSILKRRGFKCTSISMESISFKYSYRVGVHKLHSIRIVQEHVKKFDRSDEA